MKELKVFMRTELCPAAACAVVCAFAEDSPGSLSEQTTSAR